MLRRLLGLESQDAEIRRLRRRVVSLDLELARRRSDDILAARACGVPVPRPGSAGARLLSENRTLRRHVERLERGEADPPRELAQLTPAIATEIETSWARADRAAVILVARRRVVALTGWDRMPDADELALAADHAVEALVGDGPIAAARVIEPYEVTADGYAVGAEALLFALAGDHGPPWFGEPRRAWTVGLDALAVALGFPEISGTGLFSTDESTDISTV